jgi:hypothetical protein
MTKAETLLAYLESMPSTVGRLFRMSPWEVLDGAVELRVRANLPRPVLPPEPPLGARDPDELQSVPTGAQSATKSD